MTIMTLAALLASGTAVPAATTDDAQQSRAPDIIVTAKPDPEDPPVVAQARARLARTPGSVSVVAAETYEDRAVVGLPDLLRDVPGVLSNKRYGEESRLSIRGSGLDQSFHQRGVLLAQDGVPFADADGFSDFQKVDPLGARFIEVYKGGNALRFGGAQLGGAVNLVTPNGRTAESPFLFRAEAGAFETYRVAAAGSGTAGRFDYYAGINSYHSQGYRQQEAQDQIRGTLNLGYSLGDDSEVRVIAYAADIEQQVPGTLTLAQALTNPRMAGAGAVAGRQARNQTVERVSLQTRLRLSDGLVFEGGVYGTQTDLYHPVGIVITQDTDTQGAFGRFDLTGTIAGHKADLFFGAYYRQGGTGQGLFTNSGGNPGVRIGNTKQDATGLDVFGEGRFFLTDSFALVAGGSWGRATRDYANRLSAKQADADFTWFAPRAGVLFEKGDVQVYGNITRSVEPPHFGALAQVNTTGSVFSPVDPQRAWTAEAGTRGRVGAVTFDVTFYRAWVRGELLSFLAAANLPSTVFNAGDTLHQGVEASLDWRILSGARGSLRLRQTYAWSDFRFDGDRIYGDNRLPVAPEHQYRAALRYDAPRSVAAGLFVEPSLDWRVKDVWVDYANTLKAPGYALLNLSAGLDLPHGVTLFADARNLTDTRYAAEFAAVTDARTATTAVFYPGEGQSVFGGVRFRF
ncbi:TonB-dependent receptor [Sphingomonas sp. EC-HK361]|uniref:TonB-dependent receptor family protein n=1 Tax=Sphingomonas sp. EC-HK361 TaxID=2038397 RepID=UPI001257A091|nr:TonB-dependent receptor [Sphingomonas sp. EC-HK361]VVT14852.1 TonB-dependent receptor [Sphingomonas sp. EC-HK361]